MLPGLKGIQSKISPQMFLNIDKMWGEIEQYSYFVNNYNVYYLA